MVSTGVFPVWNTVAVDSGVLIFSRVVRQLLLRSLPDRTMGPLASMVLPVPARQRGDSFEVVYPGENTGTPIGVEGVGTYRYGVVLRSPTYRGFYEIIRTAVEEQDDEPPFLLAFNGPAAESRLVYVSQEDLMGRINSENTRWVSARNHVSGIAPSKNSALFLSRPRKKDPKAWAKRSKYRSSLTSADRAR